MPLLERSEPWALAERKISAYVAAGRAKHPGEVKRKITGPLTKASATNSSGRDGEAATG